MLQQPGCCNFKFNIQHTPKKLKIQGSSIHVKGILVGSNTRELCQLDPFVVVRHDWNQTHHLLHHKQISSNQTKNAHQK